MAERSILDEQMAYYRARAAEYDEWFYREGRYDRGPAETRAWFDEVRIVSEELGRFGVGGDVLELACGTGIWTALLARRASSVTAVDASVEMLSINRAKLSERDRVGEGWSTRVRYVQADLFNWKPERQYDAVFFGFWLSHVPAKRFDSFWDLVVAALKPGGRFFFVDSLPDPQSSASDHETPTARETRQRRLLNDGSSYEIIKIYYAPKDLEHRLRQRGFSATVKSSGRYFLYGFGTV